jgi:hypothetical protein
MTSCILLCLPYMGACVSFGGPQFLYYHLYTIIMIHIIICRCVYRVLVYRCPFPLIGLMLLVLRVQIYNVMLVSMIHFPSDVIRNHNPNGLFILHTYTWEGGLAFIFGSLYIISLIKISADCA